MGQMVTINQVLDQETAMIVVEEMGHKALQLNSMTLSYFWKKANFILQKTLNYYQGRLL